MVVAVGHPARQVERGIGRHDRDRDGECNERNVAQYLRSAAVPGRFADRWSMFWNLRAMKSADAGRPDIRPARALSACIPDTVLQDTEMGLRLPNTLARTILFNPLYSRANRLSSRRARGATSRGFWLSSRRSPWVAGFSECGTWLQAGEGSSAHQSKESGHDTGTEPGVLRHG